MPSAPTTSSNSAWRRTTTTPPTTASPSGCAVALLDGRQRQWQQGACWGWGVGPLVQVFNYMEQTILYNAYNAELRRLGLVSPEHQRTDPLVGQYDRLQHPTYSFLCPSDTRQLPQSSQMTVVNYGGNYGGPFVMGGYTGTIIPDSNPGWATTTPTT